MRRAFGSGFIFLAFTAGCASLSESDCRSADWQARGWQDGLSGNRAQIELYAEQCSPFGVTPDEKQYMAGWSLGYAEWNRRVSRGRP